MSRAKINARLRTLMELARNSLPKRHIVAVTALGVTAAIVNQGAAQAADPGITDTEISIGMFGPMSGPLTAFGIDPIQGGKTWYDEVNKKGGIHGRTIKVQVEDDKCSQNEAVSVVKKLISVDKVFLINGGGCTPAVAAVQELIGREKVPLLLGVASGDPVLFPPQRYIFGGFGATQRATGATMIEFVVKHLGAKRIALIAHDDDYGKASVDIAQNTAKRLGVEIVATERIARDLTDLTAPLLRIRGAAPDVIVSGAYPAPAALIAQKYGEFGMTNIPLVSATQGVPTPAVFAKNVGNLDALKNFYFQWVLLDLVDEGLQKKWLDLYKQYYPNRTPGPFMFAGLPSAMTMTAALEKAGRNVTRESFIDAIETLDLKLDLFPDNIVLSKNRHDANRSTFFIKFDGKSMQRLPEVYRWNGQD